MRPSSDVASFKVTSGLPTRIRVKKPALASLASSAQSPVSTASPAAFNRRTPSPATRGSGSSSATTTRFTPPAISASVQGGVRPQWQQGSRLTKAVAPRAARPARRSASVSPCGRPPGCVQPRPTTLPALTMTQPTAGLGQTIPSPRRAKASAAPIAFWSKRWLADEPPGLRLSSVAIRGDPPDEIPEILGLAEIAVDRCETDVGDLIEACQRLHHEAADNVAGDIRLARTLQLPHQRIDDALDPFGFDGAFPQRDVDGASKLISVKRFALPVFLDNRQLAQLDTLEGREAGRTIRTEPPAPDSATIIRRPGVLYLSVIGPAKRTAHPLLPVPLREAMCLARVRRRSGTGRRAREHFRAPALRRCRCRRVLARAPAAPRRCIDRPCGTRPIRSRASWLPANRAGYLRSPWASVGRTECR